MNYPAEEELLIQQNPILLLRTLTGTTFWDSSSCGVSTGNWKYEGALRPLPPPPDEVERVAEIEEVAVAGRIEGESLRDSSERRNQSERVTGEVSPSAIGDAIREGTTSSRSSSREEEAARNSENSREGPKHNAGEATGDDRSWKGKLEMKKREEKKSGQSRKLYRKHDQWRRAPSAEKELTVEWSLILQPRR